MNINFNSNMMTGFKTRRQKFGASSLIIMLLFGTAFTGAGVLALKSIKIDPSWSRVSGQVINSSSVISSSSTTYAAVVQYKVNGQNYQITSSTSSSAYPHIGDSRQVAYNPALPNEAKVVEGAGTTWLIYLLPAIGIACFVIAPVAFIMSLRRSGDINHLIRDGQKIQGVITDIQSTGNDNNSGYKIVVSATNNTGTVQSYVSDKLAGIGGLAMADFRNNPIPLDVYVNLANPMDYYIDISEIPNLTSDRIAELIKSAIHSQPNSVAAGEKPPTLPPSPTIPLPPQS